MTGWSFLVYFSAGIVYLAVAATLIGWIRHARSRDLD